MSETPTRWARGPARDSFIIEKRRQWREEGRDEESELGQDPTQAVEVVCGDRALLSKAKKRAEELWGQTSDLWEWMGRTADVRVAFRRLAGCDRGLMGSARYHRRPNEAQHAITAGETGRLGFSIAHTDNAGRTYRLRETLEKAALESWRDSPLARTIIRVLRFRETECRAQDLWTGTAGAPVGGPRQMLLSHVVSNRISGGSY